MSVTQSEPRPEDRRTAPIPAPTIETLGDRSAQKAGVGGANMAGVDIADSALEDTQSYDSLQDLPATNQYLALSSSAAACLALGVVSVVALLDWLLVVIPLAAIGCGVTALVSIRRYPDVLTGKGLAWAGITLATAFWVGGWSWMGYAYIVECPAGYERLSFRQLLTPKEQPQLVPEEVVRLNGKKVFIKGYFRPGTQLEANKFLLVRDNQECCFGDKLPVPGDMMYVTLPAERTIKYSQKLWHAWGTLKIEWQSTLLDSGVLYHLQADEVQ